MKSEVKYSVRKVFFRSLLFVFLNIAMLFMHRWAFQHEPILLAITFLVHIFGIAYFPYDWLSGVDNKK